MDKKLRYTLSGKEKLKGRKTIDHLFREGTSFAVYPFRVIYLLQEEADAELLQVGFTVSTRYFKKAADRNRIKRLLREAYRLQKHSLLNELTQKNKRIRFFIMYTGNELPDHTTVFEKTGIILNRLEKIIHA